jgi:hypothetical protein
MAETDREMELATRLAALELRLADVEAKAAASEARAREAEARAGGGPLGLMDAVLTAVLPAEARGHLRAARKEQLLAVRSLVDTWIERVDRKADEPRRRRRESIPLEDA